MLTDAVVAIAMTILVLPVVDVAREVDTARLGGFLGDNSDLLWSFAISFVVIYVFWAAHAGALRRLAEGDTQVAGLGLLNLLWLLVIAFLPFPTAVVGHQLDTRSAPFYIGTMLVLSALTSAIGLLVDRHTGRPGQVWAWVTTAVFGACTVISLFDADLGLLALLALLVLRLLERRAVGARTAG